MTQQRRQHSWNPSIRRATPVVALLIAALLTAALLTPGPAAAAVAEPAGGLPLFLDRVEVDLVNVEAFVADRAGHRVTGLGRDDFELRVDGEPVEITHFFAASPTAGNGDAADSEPAAARAPQAASEALGAPDLETGRQPLLLVIFVDNRQLHPGNRKRALDELAHLVPERVAGGDRVMLAAYGLGLEIVEPFTRDPEALAAGLHRITKMAAYRPAEDTAVRTALNRNQWDFAGGFSPGSEGAVRGGAQAVLDSQARGREGAARGSAGALGSMLRSLAGLPGRKALLYVSDGLPGSGGSATNGLGSAAAEGPLAQGRELRLAYNDLVQQANAAEVTVYAFDARGPNPSLARSAESPDILGLASTSGPVQEGVEFDFARDTELQAPLLDLALGTGGKAVLNTFNLDDAIADLAEDFGNYYSLGFVAPAAGDGAYHRIELRVKRPGLTVRHRHGFFAKPTAQKVAERTRSFLSQGWEANPMGAQLQFAEPVKHRRSWRVPVLVRIPAEALTLLPQDGQRIGRVQLFVMVRDEDGKQSQVTQVVRDVVLPAEPPPATGDGSVPDDVGYTLQLDLRPDRPT